MRVGSHAWSVAQFALKILEKKYPMPPHEAKLEGPVLYLDREDLRHGHKGWLIPDISLFLGGRLVCIVEIGALTRPDKLLLWEKYLPSVHIVWIPKFSQFGIERFLLT